MTYPPENKKIHNGLAGWLVCWLCGYIQQNLTDDKQKAWPNTHFEIVRLAVAANVLLFNQYASDRRDSFTLNLAAKLSTHTIVG